MAATFIGLTALLLVAGVVVSPSCWRSPFRSVSSRTSCGITPAAGSVIAFNARPRERDPESALGPASGREPPNTAGRRTGRPVRRAIDSAAGGGKCPWSQGSVGGWGRRSRRRCRRPRDRAPPTSGMSGTRGLRDARAQPDRRSRDDPVHLPRAGEAAPSRRGGRRRDGVQGAERGVRAVDELIAALREFTSPAFDHRASASSSASPIAGFASASSACVLTFVNVCRGALADLRVADDDAVEVVERRQHLPVAAGEGPIAGGRHRLCAVDRLCRLEPAVVEPGDRRLVARGVGGEPRQKTRVDERHVAGDDGDVLARGGSTGVPNARDRSEVGLVVDRPAERKREAVERVSDRFSLIGPTIYHEFVDDRVAAAGGALGARRTGSSSPASRSATRRIIGTPQAGRRPCLGRRSASSAPGEDGSGGHGSSRCRGTSRLRSVKQSGRRDSDRDGNRERSAPFSIPVAP